MEKTANIRRQHIIAVVVLAALGLVPVFSEPFYIRMVSRIMIYALCAVSLDLILGYGGMVSLGHAAFLGVGAYTVGILAQHGIQTAWIAWPAAAALAAVAALAIGAVSIRTSGVYFIMITLAFAQMLFYFCSSLEQYGGDDGLALANRSSFGHMLNIADNTTFYYLVWVILIAALYAAHRIVNSRFGMVIRGLRENERRMQSIGFPAFRYKLVCFVIAGAIAGLAGALIANQNNYVSPALMHWTRSGDILVMVILGGIGTLIGPVLGALGLLLAEEFLAEYTRHWMIFLGPLLIFVVLFARGGLYGLLHRKDTP
jgi:branched-chain amino acid transport system permease protein